MGGGAELTFTQPGLHRCDDGTHPYSTRKNGAVARRRRHKKRRSRPVSRVLYALRRDSHSSRPGVTARLQQPTRGRRGQRHSPLIWSCSGWGLPCHATLSPHAVRSYRTLSPLPDPLAGPSAVCSLLHWPSAHAAQELPGTLPYGARTFLDTPEGATRLSGRLQGRLYGITRDRRWLGARLWHRVGPWAVEQEPAGSPLGATPAATRKGRAAPRPFVYCPSGPGRASNGGFRFDLLSQRKRPAVLAGPLRAFSVRSPRLRLPAPRGLPAGSSSN